MDDVMTEVALVCLSNRRASIYHARSYCVRADFQAVLEAAQETRLSTKILKSVDPTYYTQARSKVCRFKC